MSEETEVPIVCDDCGGNLTNAGGTIDDLFSMALGEDRPHYWHMEQSGCIASLNERLTAATQRAEAAEAMRDDIIAICRGTQLDDAAIHSMRGYVTEKLRIEAECEALRKDAERLDAIESGEVHIECMGMTLRHMNVYSKHGKCVTSGLFGTQLSLTLRQAIDAAMAVQPTTGGGDE